MQEKSVIITPNRRLAYHLARKNYKVFAKKNITTWYSPKIISLSDWLIECWLEHKDPRILLTPHQEKIIWNKIIAKYLGQEFLSLSGLFIKAHNLLIEWQIDDTLWSEYETEEISIFKDLNKKFREYLKNNNLIVSSELPLLLHHYIVTYYSEIILYGFSEYNPNFLIFIDNIKKLKSNISYINSSDASPICRKKIGFKNQGEEIIGAARWAQNLINTNKDLNIGVVVSNLNDLRSEVDKIFTEILGYEKFNISVGVSLNSLHIIDSILEIFKYNKYFTSKTFGNILFSPYIIGASCEKSNRAILDFHLNQLGCLEFNLSDIEAVSNKYECPVPLLITSLKKREEIFTQVYNKKLYPSEWSKIFTQIIIALEWPQVDGLNLREKLAIKHFYILLQDFEKNDFITEKVTYAHALYILHDLISSTTFNPDNKNEEKVKVNILGVLEASGLEFSHLWLMGLDQENWPTSCNPNPFIPIKIQKKLNLPHSSAKRELDFCNNMINNFTKNSANIIFSYVAQKEGINIEPSSLISDTPSCTLDDLNLGSFASKMNQVYLSRKIENMPNDYTQVTAQKKELTKGIKFIELQSICPFKAFAQFHLGIQEFKPIQIGPSKMDRGILIHSALEYFWKKTKNHQNLCKLCQTDLSCLIAESALYALKKLNQNKPYQQQKNSTYQQLYKLEYDCLIQLLGLWLNLEKQREPFEVLETEKTISINLAESNINLRIDRIDQISSDKIILIDYKTSKKIPSVYDMVGIRPEYLQLPVYCIALANITGFAFVHLNHETIKFKKIGIEELNYALQIINNTHKHNQKNLGWSEFVLYWENIVNNLIKELIQGKANPTPLAAKICKNCEFGTICRNRKLAN